MSSKSDIETLQQEAQRIVQEGEASERLERLTTHWRAEAGKMSKRGWLQSIRRAAIEDCANELERVLRSIQHDSKRVDAGDL